MTPAGGADASAGEPGQRLDKWLWFARVVKSRSLATELIVSGKVRVNRERAAKPSQTVRRGDIVTAVVHRSVRVLRVVQPGERRGPAPEARELYEDLSPGAEGSAALAPGTAAFPGAAATQTPRSRRPGKRERRQLARLKNGEPP